MTAAHMTIGGENARSEMSGNGSGAFENLAQSGDLFRRPVGNVGESAVVNLAILAKGLAQQDGGGRTTVGNDRHVHVDMIP